MSAYKAAGCHDASPTRKLKYKAPVILNATRLAANRVKKPKAMKSAPTDSQSTTNTAGNTGNGNPSLPIWAANPHELHARRPLTRGKSQVNLLNP